MTDTTTRSLRIFLCHSSADKPTVRDLYRRLTADGFSPWLNEENLLPGQEWEREIPRAVRAADVVIVCLSRGSITKAGYVQKEIKFALDVADEQPDGTIFLIPLKLEECDVPERLSRWQWVNQFEANGYARLVRSMHHRAESLGLNVSPTASAGSSARQPTTKDTPTSSTSNVSGGVNVDANSVTVGNDVVGRDKIIQAGMYIEHATIIQATPQTPESKITSPTAYKIEVRKIGDMEFVRVPAGKFLMGSKADNELAGDDEKPQHTIEIPYDYWIARYPATNGQFAEFITAVNYRFDQGDWQKEPDHPVVCVTWHDAMTYCRWLNNTLRDELKDLTLRLPTESEWEKAARGTQGNEWSWGNEFDQNKCNTWVSGKEDTTPVGAYSPQGDSPYDAADMLGNVLEWCHSLYKPYPYQASDGRESEAGDGDRVLRGGSWINHEDDARCACRYNYSPDIRLNYDGFRCCLSRGVRF
jgi:formylglycine-generating enzyme required for sulfatase activity